MHRARTDESRKRRERSRMRNTSASVCRRSSGHDVPWPVLTPTRPLSSRIFSKRTASALQLLTLPADTVDAMMRPIVLHSVTNGRSLQHHPLRSFRPHDGIARDHAGNGALLSRSNGLGRICGRSLCIFSSANTSAPGITQAAIQRSLVRRVAILENGVLRCTVRNI